jgi:hypothetical protein
MLCNMQLKGVLGMLWHTAAAVGYGIVTPMAACHFDQQLACGFSVCTCDAAVPVLLLSTAGSLLSAEAAAPRAMQHCSTAL